MKILKKAIWVGDSLKSLKCFPDEVQDGIGYSLWKIQEGLIPKNVKILKGIKPTVMEIVTDYDTNTYRAVYTVKIDKVVYILHCFQKKSKRGIKTPKHEIDQIKQRLHAAEAISKLRGKLYE